MTRSVKRVLLCSSFAVAMIGAFEVGVYLRDSGAARFALKPSGGSLQLAQGGGESGYAFRGTSSPGTGERRGEEDASGARRTFEAVYSLVQQYYVDKLPADRQLSRGAIRGMLASLNDPNCYFLEPEQFSLIEAEQRGRYAGIGASLVVRAMPRDGYTEYKIVVAAPIPGSPAEKAGLRPGDVITHVGGRWVLGYDPFLRANRLADKLERNASESQTEEVRKEFTAARNRAQAGIGLLTARMILRGDVATTKRLNLPTDSITVTVERTGGKNPLSLEMTPTVTEVPPVSTRVLPDGSVYIRVPAFTTKTTEQLRAALADLSRVKGVVLDLRGNPGGLSETATEADGLLSSGGVFGQELRPGGKTVSVKPAVYSGVNRPLAILTDKGTASVAEALAAALMEKSGAILVGGPTSGEALLQTAYALPDGSAFVLATGKMIGPRRADWAGVGLIPKVAVAQGASDDQWLRRAADVLRQRPRIAENEYRQETQ